MAQGAFRANRACIPSTAAIWSPPWTRSLPPPPRFRGDFGTAGIRQRP